MACSVRKFRKTEKKSERDLEEIWKRRRDGGGGEERSGARARGRLGPGLIQEGEQVERATWSSELHGNGICLRLLPFPYKDDEGTVEVGWAVLGLGVGGRWLGQSARAGLAASPQCVLFFFFFFL